MLQREEVKDEEEIKEVKERGASSIGPTYFEAAQVVINSLGVVGVAQLAEHRTVAPNVVGSNPISHPNPQRSDPDT